MWQVHWGHQYHENSLFSSVSVLPLPLPPKAGSNGSYVGQNVSTQFPMLGEQFRNVNIVPQVITVLRAEGQIPWPGEETGWTHWKKAKITVESCRWNGELLQTQIRQTKNPSDLPAEVICACMREKRGKKIFSQKLIRVQQFLWWWHRSDTSACTACLGWRFSSLPSALIRCKALNTRGCGACLGSARMSLVFQSDLVSVFISWLSLSSVFFTKKPQKTNKGGFPQSLHAMAELPPQRK